MKSEASFRRKAKTQSEERGCFLQCDHTGEKQKSKKQKNRAQLSKNLREKKNAVL